MSSYARFAEVADFDLRKLSLAIEDAEPNVGGSGQLVQFGGGQSKRLRHFLGSAAAPILVGRRFAFDIDAQVGQAVGRLNEESARAACADVGSVTVLPRLAVQR